MKTIFSGLPQKAILTTTPDNWTEFSWREEVKNELWIDFYFTYTYSSREKWIVERKNGFIRRFFPKKTDFATITNEEIQFVEDWINNRANFSIVIEKGVNTFCAWDKRTDI
jgi:IS30 family transposase